MKMQKLNEDGSYMYQNFETKTNAFHINPQTDNVTDDIMNSAIDYLHEKFNASTHEGSGWSLHSLNEAVVNIVASHKTGIPTGRCSVGTWSKLPKGMRGHNLIKKFRTKPHRKLQLFRSMNSSTFI